MSSPDYFILRPAIYPPVLIAVIAGSLAVTSSAWWLLAIPFGILGTICGQPNLNLADGCLAVLAAFAGLALTVVHAPSGVAIACGSFGGMIMGSIEKHIFAKPVFKEDTRITDAPRR